MIAAFGFLMYLIVVMCLAAYALITILEGYNANERLSGWIAGFLCLLLCSWGLAWVEEAELRNPCVQYESRMTYNAATKTMMPLRVCVERGEWESQQ
jgi:high-affinity Fe2+/Pb2+ permease